MSKYIPGNHRHLTAADRLYIERQLNASSSFKDIARYLCKDPSTISKEVRSHRLSDFYPGRGALPECQKLLHPSFPLSEEECLWQDPSLRH